jgi:hypothetical protein
MNMKRNPHINTSSATKHARFGEGIARCLSGPQLQRHPLHLASFEQLACGA